MCYSSFLLVFRITKSFALPQISSSTSLNSKLSSHIKPFFPISEEKAKKLREEEQVEKSGSFGNRGRRDGEE